MSWTLRVKRGAELVNRSPPGGELDPLAEEEVGQTWQTQTYCEGLLGTSLAEPSVSGRSSTPTSGRASHRFRGRLGTLSPSGPCSLPPLSTHGSSKLWTQGLWCLSWRQPPNQVVDTGRYRQAKQAAARMVLEAKTRVWEEFGEAMEEDYRSASKRFWQTVWMLWGCLLG
ncbi:hypothetical protein L3Q82_017397 [Scortum barcoo]|uniref:Uncharacterized protein n=1 Tax=Scortum barcoo TaxID=214431 RepID=A0ACB8VKJ1_9TELE|nr:hypothetical protein L3Q82_017397 [Scortum barcoo]